jgi:hypothetical protein
MAPSLPYGAVRIWAPTARVGWIGTVVVRKEHGLMRPRRPHTVHHPIALRALVRGDVVVRLVVRIPGIRPRPAPPASSQGGGVEHLLGEFYD